MRILITERFREGFWTLTSKNLPGFLLCGRDKDKLLADAPEAARLLLKMNNGVSPEHIEIVCD